MLEHVPCHSRGHFPLLWWCTTRINGRKCGGKGGAKRKDKVLDARCKRYTLGFSTLETYPETDANCNETFLLAAFGAYVVPPAQAVHVVGLSNRKRTGSGR